MGKLLVFLFLSILLFCTARRIGMFDFNNRNATKCVKNIWPIASNSSVTDLAAAIFKGDKIGILPDKVTICSTIYADLDDCDSGTYQTHPYNSPRIYPTWAFVDESGKVNLSLKVHGIMDKRRHPGKEELFLEMGTKWGMGTTKTFAHALGTIQLFISLIFKG